MSDNGIRNEVGSVRSEQLEAISEVISKSIEDSFAEIASKDLLNYTPHHFGTILADPPWRFNNRTGKMAPEHQRLRRYPTMKLDEIMELPVARIAQPSSHLYLWVPNALLEEGLEVMKRWGFTYKTNIVWTKIRKDGGPDGRGVGFYFRNVTELCLFGVRGSLRTKQPGRRQVNYISTRKREHSRKPDELYDIIEACSPGPYIELFARHEREGWTSWGNEIGIEANQTPKEVSYRSKTSEQLYLELTEKRRFYSTFPPIDNRKHR